MASRAAVGIALSKCAHALWSAPSQPARPRPRRARRYSSPRSAVRGSSACVPHLADRFCPDFGFALAALRPPRPKRCSAPMLPASDAWWGDLHEHQRPVGCCLHHRCLLHPRAAQDPGCLTRRVSIVDESRASAKSRAPAVQPRKPGVARISSHSPPSVPPPVVRPLVPRRVCERIVSPSCAARRAPGIPQALSRGASGDIPSSTRRACLQFGDARRTPARSPSSWKASPIWVTTESRGCLMLPYRTRSTRRHTRRAVITRLKLGPTYRRRANAARAP